MGLANRLDWVAKYRMVNGYRERHGLGWRDPKLLAMDLQYHDVRPERSLYARAGMERLLAPEAVERAMTEPPTTTRAYFRGRCLQRWPQAIAAANWDSLGVRPGPRPPAEGPDDGAAQRYGGACR